MEFETEAKSRKPDEITDEVRLSAANRQVTLAPLHDDVQPEQISDEQEAGRHVLEPPVGNIPSDQENTEADAIAAHPTETGAIIIPPLKAKSKSSALPFLFLGIFALAVVIVAVVFVVVR